MAKVVETDEHVMLSDQLDEDVGPIILINKFNVKPEEADQFVKAWEKDAAYFKSQPGFISAHSIEELVVAVYSSTMQFGNPLRCSRRRLAKLTCRNYYQIIPPAQ